MLGKQLCLALLIILLLPADVSGQTIAWGAIKNLLSKSQCFNPDITFEGERIVLNAVLNTSQSNSSDWPLHQIYLQQLSYEYGESSICDINVTRDGCHGPRQGWCGYCDKQDGDQYDLVFNVTVATNGSRVAGYRIKWISSSSAPSVLYNSYFYLTVIDDHPYTITDAGYHITYYIQDIIKYVNVLSRSSVYLHTTPSTPCQMSWSYSDQSDVMTSPYPHMLDYNVSLWNSHIDNFVKIICEDQCSRNWSFTIPVTNLPELDCDPAELYWNKSTGFQLVTRCRIPRSGVVNEPLRFDCVLSYSPFGYSRANVTTDGDISTCTFIITKDILALNTTTALNIYWNPSIDVQFTNGSGQNPRVVRFNVNGSKSVIAEPGEDVSFECKVYGNPTAVAVLVGTGLGRIQEERSDTDLLLSTLAKVQCEDSGRYTCKGVSEFGSTPGDRQAHVDVNVRCPPAVKSHVPSDSNRKFNFDPGSNILVTLEVYGYPVPTDFGLQLGQGSPSSEVDKDQYSVTSVELNPSLAVLTLIIFSRDNGGPETYVFRISNGANSSLDFRFEAGKFETDSSPSPWLYAFIAVICIVAVSLIAVIVIYIIKKRAGSAQDEFDDIRLQRTSAPSNEGQVGGQAVPKSRLQTASPATAQPERYQATSPGPKQDSSNSHLYDDTTVPDEEIYENVRDSLYETPQ